MRLPSFAFASAFVLSSLVQAQDAALHSAVTTKVAATQATAAGEMRVGFATRDHPDGSDQRLELDADGTCRHYMFLAIGAQADVALIASVAIMAQPLLVVPLAVYQASGLESYPIVNLGSVPPGVDIYLQGVAFPLAGCGPGPALTATDVLHLFRSPANDTAPSIAASDTAPSIVK